ncbi:MAG: zinc ABC transporter substrate-binding protein [Ruminiclostridium sp.]|nr:zinc ABC transporter substrate-binding protein [Ruminiclostridium sp.]
MKRKHIIPALAAAALALTSGCSGNAGQELPQDGLKVVTVNFPPYDFVRQLTGGDTVPEMLLKGGQDAHTYEPSAKDIIKINEADIFICTGGESDAWVDRIAASLDGGVRIIRMMDCISSPIEEEHDDDHDDDHGEVEYDEHVWTSPKNAAAICEVIAAELAAADPDNAEKYSAGLTAYKAELGALSDELEAAARSLGKPLIFGDRFPFAYMARDYGIEYHAAFAGCSSDTEPSAAKMKELIECAEEADVDRIYHIEFSTEKVAKAVAEAVGAETRLMHSCHTLSDSDLAAGKTYISVMRDNIAAMM